MKKERMYKDLAKYYDLVYSWKDYKKESQKIIKLIKKYKKSKGKELLEAACGTGHHIRYFKKKFKCTGFDINQGIVNVAKKKVKGVVFKKANMINFKFNKKFDVIVCLFSSIGYVKTYSNLKKTINNFSKHLKKRGVVIIEPWFEKSKFIQGRQVLHTYKDDKIKIARISNTIIKGNISILDMRFLIAEKGKQIKYYTDKHEMGLFDVSKTLKFMKQAGLKARFLKNGLMRNRGLLIGIKEA